MEQIHIVPVGFDHDRLLAPLTRGDLTPEKILLVVGAESAGTGRANALARKIRSRLERKLATLTTAEVETQEFTDFHDFESIYQDAHELLMPLLEREEREVWINISSAPRPVGFAISSVLHTYIAESPERRSDIHLYYVIPESYLVTDMIDQLTETEEDLRRTIRDLSNIVGEGDADRRSLQPLVDDLIDRREALSDLREKIDQGGVTTGTVEIDGKSYMEIPLSLLPGLKGTRATSGLNESEINVLRSLSKEGAAESLDELASRISAGDVGSSKVSTVRYNVLQLEQKGFLIRNTDGRRHQVELTPMGRLWVSSMDLDRHLEDVRQSHRRRRAGEEP